MKLIDGKTLDDLLRERQNAGHELPRFVGIFEQICQTVGFAHQQSVLHRDLKPLNIMVGAFGEVQVMDWGVGKRLRDTSPTEAPDITTSGPPTVIEPACDDETVMTPAVDMAEEMTDSAGTRAGMVLGTPAYMAPEQARGEVDELDERCDVFGLGAILCRILTDEPPFTGRNALAVIADASKGDLSSAWSRLDACGADSQLVEVCKSCLAPEKTQRPRRGADVAVTVTAYREHVQERARLAEIASAEAKTKVIEARKRLRIGVGLAGSVLLLLIVSAAAGVSYWTQSRDRVAQALRLSNDAKEVHDEFETKVGERGGVFEMQNTRKRWTERIAAARSDLKKAEVLCGSFEDWIDPDVSMTIADLNESLERDESDWEIASDLGTIRERRMSIVDNTLDYDYARKHYSRAFKEAGIGVLNDRPELVAGRIRESRIREQLIAALDDWALVTILEESPENVGRQQTDVLGDLRLRSWLIDTARLADDDGWANRLRSQWFQLLSDPTAAAKYVESMPAMTSPQMLALLVELPALKSWVRIASSRHPRDFSVNYAIATSLRTTAPDEAYGYLRAALAANPGSSNVYNSWGVTLLGQKRHDEAVVKFEEAIAIDPEFSMPYNNIGQVLFDREDFAGAKTYFEKAISLSPDFALAHYNLGNVFDATGDPDAAIKCYQRSLALNPVFAKAHHNLGTVLKARGKLKEAMEHFQQAGAVDPKFTKSYVNLGNQLLAKKDLEGAIRNYLAALAIDPDLWQAHNNLSEALRTKGDFEGAVEHGFKAVALAPDPAAAHLNLGAAFFAAKRLDEAATHLTKAIELNPDSAAAHSNLGSLLLGRGDRDGALKHCQRAVDLDPTIAEVHSNLGSVLLTGNDAKIAIAHYRKSVEIDPTFANGHNLLGVALAKSKESRQAITHLRKAIALNAKNAVFYSNLGSALKQSGDDKAAVANYEKALAIDPNLGDAHASLGQLRLKNGKLDDALKHLKKAAAAFPDSASVQADIGTTYLSKRQIAPAFEHLKKAVALNPKNVEAHNNLAAVYQAKGDLDGAIKHLKMTVSLAPKRAMGHFNLGVTLYSKKDLKGAIPAIEQAIALDPKNAQFRNVGTIFNSNFANQLRAQGELEESVKHVKKAIGHDSNNFHAHFNLGATLNAMADFDAAAASFQKALSLNPKSANALGFLGLVYQRQGKFARGLTYLEKSHKLGSKNLAGRERSQKWISDCRKLIAEDAAVAAVLKDGKRTQTPGKLLRMAEFCRKYKTQNSAAMKFAKEIEEQFPPLKSLNGMLSKKQREQPHKVKFQAGKMYSIVMESNQLDSYLRLLDAKGTELGTDDDGGIQPNSRLIFTPPETGEYRIIASTPPKEFGKGSYRLTIRELDGDEANKPAGKQ